MKPPELIVLTGQYRLGDTPYEFQRVIDSLFKNIPFTNCYIDDILFASKESQEEHKAILWKDGSKKGNNKLFFNNSDAFFRNLTQ